MLRPRWTRPLAQAWGERHLATAYLAGDDRLQAFYAHPCSWAALPAAQRVRRESRRAAPDAVADGLEASLLDLQPHEAVRRSLEHLASGRAWALVAGQQPGLLGGPLYSFYKALTLVRQARVLSERTGEPFVPLFWVASEDDDFDEVATAWIVDRTTSLQPIRLQPAPARPVSVGPLPIDWRALRGELEDRLPESDARPALLDELARAYDGHSLAQGFTRLLLSGFGAQGLLVVDPMWPAMRRLMAPLVEEVLDDPLFPTRRANQAGDGLSELGFSPQVHKQERLCPFYVYGSQGERQRLVCGGEVLAAGEQAWDRRRLKTLLRDDPERFSLSLILRPVAQDYLFPTAAFFGGPGEIAYFAQLKGVYERLQVAMPLVMPRFAATLVEPKADRILEKYGLPAPALWEDVEALLSRLVREQFGEEAEGRFQQAQARVDAALAPLVEWVESVDANLAKPGAQTRHRVEFEINRLLDKTVRALKRQHEVLGEQVRSVSELLYPQRQLQERVLNPYAFWVRYGNELRQALAQWPVEEAAGAHVFLGW